MHVATSIVLTMMNCHQTNVVAQLTLAYVKKLLGDVPCKNEANISISVSFNHEVSSTKQECGMQVHII